MTTATSIGKEFNEKLEGLNKELLEKKERKISHSFIWKRFARWVLNMMEKNFLIDKLSWQKGTSKSLFQKLNLYPTRKSNS